jgi:hypothetical protein
VTRCVTVRRFWGALLGSPYFRSTENKGLNHGRAWHSECNQVGGEYRLIAVPQRMTKKPGTRQSKKEGLAAPKKPAGRAALPEKVADMPNRVRRDLRILKDSIAEHATTVERRLAKNGGKPRSALVASAAKYYPTLKKLASR